MQKAADLSQDRELYRAGAGELFAFFCAEVGGLCDDLFRDVVCGESRLDVRRDLLCSSFHRERLSCRLAMCNPVQQVFVSGWRDLLAKLVACPRTEPRRPST